MAEIQGELEIVSAPEAAPELPRPMRAAGRRWTNTVEPAPERSRRPRSADAPTRPVPEGRDAAEAAPSHRPGDVPGPLARRYFTETLRGGGLAFFEGPGAARAAFHDHGVRLATDQTHPAVARDLAAIAAHRGWTTLQVRGEDSFRREVWMEARALGLSVRGYKPRERDQQELDRRLAADRARAERGHARTARDPRRPSAPGEARAGDRPDAGRGLSGVLLEVGRAPYRRRPEAPLTPYLRLAREDGRTVDVWGAGLPAALARAGARPGDRLVVRRDAVERIADRERGPAAEPAGRGEARARGAGRAERFRAASPGRAARDPDLAGAQSHLAVLDTVIDRAVRDPERRARLRAEARELVAGELAEGRRFPPARVREIEPTLARDLAAARARDAAPERAHRR